MPRISRRQAAQEGIARNGAVNRPARDLGVIEAATDKGDYHGQTYVIRTRIDPTDEKPIYAMTQILEAGPDGFRDRI